MPPSAKSQSGPPSSAQSSPEPVTLAYRDAPTGEVVASDAVLLALRKTRPWALLFAIALLVYAVVGGGLGSVWTVVLFVRRGQPNFPVGQFIIISTGNLMFAPIALIGAVLSIRYAAAVGRAFNARHSDDLDRAILAMHRIWRWAGVCVIALIAFPLIVVLIAGIMGVFP